MALLPAIRHFPASHHSLAEISAWVSAAAQPIGFSPADLYALQTAVDEACANIIDHAYESQPNGQLTLTLLPAEDQITILLADQGQPFDLQDIPRPDLSAGIEERPVGGLGLHFIRSLMDSVSYTPKSDAGSNLLTLVKRKPSNPRPAQALEAPAWRQLLGLGEELSQQPDYPAIRAAVTHAAARLLHAEALLWVDILSLDEIANSRRASAGEFTGPAPTRFMQQASRECCTLTRIASGKARAAAPLNCPGGPDSPLRGALLVERPAGQPFSQTEIELLEGIAAQAAIAIQGRQQHLLDHWRLDQLSLVRNVSAQIASVLDLDELARRVTALILDAFQYYYVAIFTVEPRHRTLCFRDSAGPLTPGSPARQPSPPAEDHSPALTVHIGEGIIGLAAQTGEEALVNQASGDPRFRLITALPETQSEVAIPLKFKERILGVLDVQSNQAHAFGATDLLILRALADNIAIAVENAGLYADLRRRAGQLASVGEVSNAITSILNLDELLNEVVALIQKRLRFDFVQVFTVHGGRRKVFFHTGSNPGSQELRQLGFAYELDDPQGLIPWAARTGNTVLANDVCREPLYRPSSQFPFETRAEMVVPLVFGGEVLGILDVQSDQTDAFSDEDRFVLEALADNVAIAMRNATLYRSEQWRRQVADSLREVAWMLSSDADLTSVLDAVLKTLEETLPCDVAAIWLVEAPEDEAQGRLYLAAVRCGENETCAAELKEAANALLEPEAELPLDWLRAACEAPQPLIRLAGGESEPLGALLEFPADYSAIAAPLRTAGQPLGVLVLAHHTGGRYGSESQAMTTTFASYAAVAIENTRLYEASHEQTWIATVLLQIAEATQSLTDLHELAATVVQITPMLVGVEACALMLWDEHTDSFLPIASHGLSLADQQEFDDWCFRAGSEETFDDLRLLKTPLTFQTLDAPDGSLRARPLTLIPLQARGEVLGALVIEFAPDPAGHDEKLVILQGIAQQTAIAVENILLLKSQKEEAYISVALLQVAQAIVSMNDLTDILGSIVRITPILVGVRKAAIFLWDDDRGLFRLSQSYGLPHSDEEALAGQGFTPGLFPLLDAVRAANEVLYAPLPQAETSCLEWTRLQPRFSQAAPEQELPPETDSENIASEARYGRAILQETATLLLGFPLAIKGDVLAVMLAEEAGPSAAESPVHVRERRLEIVSGIAQQAALAIQNDQLQREVVERGRLEREIQLAREIQVTFLPHELPTLPGWEVDTRWQPAREVGGDFYDIIRLPEGKLGIAIADVADKGMPAALFMTLIRTLIRAAVQSENSAAAVLERVNDLLLPDTQNGMFVTVLYAVLDPATGEICYANAGHNPALVVRCQPNRVERFEKGGIALGILEGIHLEERRVWLNPGDTIVFYTDGVTEAFSPMEEMFTEERLLRTLLQTTTNPNAANPSAAAFLEAVVDAVSSFTQNSVPSDDLTMVAVRRQPV